MIRQTIRGPLLHEALLATVLFLISLAFPACARLPSVAQVIHEDPQMTVTLQDLVHVEPYTHPVQLTEDQFTAILRGLLVQKDAEKEWHYRPLIGLFTDGQARALARYLADGFQRVGPRQRVHFELRSPGNDPTHGHDVVAGWLAVQDPYLYVTIEQFHTQVPIETTDPYILSGRFATPPPPPQDYRLYFKAEEFWVADPEGRQGLQYRRFLNMAETGRSEQASG